MSTKHLLRAGGTGQNKRGRMDGLAKLGTESTKKFYAKSALLQISRSGNRQIHNTPAISASLSEYNVINQYGEGCP